MCYTQSNFSHSWRVLRSALPVTFPYAKEKEVPCGLKTVSERLKKMEGLAPLLRHRLLWCIFTSTGKRWQTYWKYVKWHSITGPWGHSARGDHRSKIISGAISLSNPWSGALFGVECAASSSRDLHWGDNWAIFNCCVVRQPKEHSGFFLSNMFYIGREKKSIHMHFWHNCKKKNALQNNLHTTTLACFNPLKGASTHADTDCAQCE